MGEYEDPHSYTTNEQTIYHGTSINLWVLPRQSIAGFSRRQSFSSHKFFERAILNRGVLISEMQGRVVWMCRVLGFKDHREYEVVMGFEAQNLGHTITAIFDPSADTETGFLSCFAEPQEAVEFLTYKRGRCGQRSSYCFFLKSFFIVSSSGANVFIKSHSFSLMLANLFMMTNIASVPLVFTPFCLRKQQL